MCKLSNHNTFHPFGVFDPKTDSLSITDLIEGAGLKIRTEPERPAGSSKRIVLGLGREDPRSGCPPPHGTTRTHGELASEVFRAEFLGLRTATES